MGFIDRRVHRNVRVSDLLRRTVAVAPRLLPGVLLPLGLLWLPALGFSWWAAGAAEQSDEWGLAVPAALSAWSLLMAPLLSALVVAPAVRAQAGSRLKARDVAFGGFSHLGAALVPALAAGMATTAGFAACVLPGYFVGALLFVVGPVAAVEGGGLGALRRASELSKDNRWMLAGVAFLITFLEGALFRLAQVLESAGDYGASFVAGSVVIAFSMLLRASASAVAYEQLRVEKEGLEIGQLAEDLGGVSSGVDELALSERSIDEMARRRAVVGKLAGQSDAPEDAEAMASVRDMQAVATRQRQRMRITVGIVATLVCTGTLVALGLGVYNRVQENREMASMEQSVREAQLALAHAAPSAETDEIGIPETDMRADLLARQIASNLHRVPAGRRKEMLGRMMALHADTFYGVGFARAFETLGKGESDEKLVDALHIAVEAAGCGPGLEKAKAAQKNRARAFAKACPEGESAPLDYGRFRASTPLGRAALAELLEMRARERRIESHPLHDVVVQLLLPEP